MVTGNLKVRSKDHYNPSVLIKDAKTLPNSSSYHDIRDHTPSPIYLYSQKNFTCKETTLVGRNPFGNVELSLT